MKKIIVIVVSISFLFQSCYSYKTVNLNNKLIAEKKYKLKVDNKFIKGKIISANDSLILFKTNTIQKEISINEIEKIKKRKVSIEKIVGLVLVSTLISIVGLFAIFYKPNLPIGPIQSPN